MRAISEKCAVNDIVNVVVNMRHGHFFGERLANALDLRSEALAG